MPRESGDIVMPRGRASYAPAPADGGAHALMRGMSKPRAYIFLLSSAIYFLEGHRSILGILGIAATVFIGGAFLIVFAYVCARLSGPRTPKVFL